MSKTRTQDPFALAVLDELRTRGQSARWLAERVGVHHTHLSKVLRQEKPPSAQLVQATRRTLELPAGYFVEERQAVVVEGVRRDPKLRDRLYNRLK